MGFICAQFPFLLGLGGGLGKRWPSFGDQLPPDEDVSTSKACGTVDSLIKIKFKSKFSPEITVEKDESVAETKRVSYFTGVMAASEIPPQMANFQTFSLKDLFFPVRGIF